MSQTSTPVPDSDPLMGAWKSYTRSEEYKNAEEWLHFPEHRKGSMWNAFLGGWTARHADPATVAEPPATALNPNPAAAAHAGEPQAGERIEGLVSMMQIGTELTAGGGSVEMAARELQGIKDMLSTAQEALETIETDGGEMGQVAEDALQKIEDMDSELRSILDSQQRGDGETSGATQSTTAGNRQHAGEGKAEGGIVTQYKPSDKSMQQAATAWCFKKTMRTVIDTDLALAFAAILDEVKFGPVQAGTPVHTLNVVGQLADPGKDSTGTAATEIKPKAAEPAPLVGRPESLD